MKYPSAAICLFLLAFSTFPGLIFAQQPDESTSYANRNQVITSDEIEAAGVTRLSDLFELVDGWYVLSLNGYNYRASVNGLSPTRQPLWTLIIDDHEVDLRVMEMQNLNLLPLHISQIKRVEVTNKPVFENGVVTTAGLIRLYTKEPERGVNASAAISVGNEIDDPGPFRYTNQATANIDRIGPTASFTLGYAGEGWYIEAGLKVDEHHVTDTQIYQRIWRLYTGKYKPRLLLTSPSLRLGIRSHIGDFNVSAGRTELNDLLFLEPYGKEIPTLQDLTFAGLSGDIKTGKNNGIRFDVGYKRHILDPRPNRQDLELNWQQDHIHGRLEGRFSYAWLTAFISGRYNRYETVTTFNLIKPALTIRGVAVNIIAAPIPSWKQSITVDMVNVSGGVNIKALAESIIVLTERQKMILSVSSIERTAAEENSLWYWAGQGYDIFERDRLIFDDLTDHTPTNLQTADISWILTPADRLSLILSGSFRQFYRQHLAHHLFTYKSGWGEFYAETTVAPNTHGWGTGLSLDIRHRLGDALEHRLYYCYLRSFSDDPIHQAAWANQPWHRFGYSVWFSPNPRFSIYARARVFSSTEWPEYKMVAVTSGNQYPAKLPSTYLISLSVSKKLWHEYLSVNVSLKNLGNVAYRSHPGGSISHLMFYFSIRAHIN